MLTQNKPIRLRYDRLSGLLLISPWIIGLILLKILPILAFLLWRSCYYGLAFSLVEEEFFGRGLLSLGYTFIVWSDGFRAIFGPNPRLFDRAWTIASVLIMGMMCTMYMFDMWSG